MRLISDDFMLERFDHAPLYVHRCNFSCNCLEVELLLLMTELLLAKKLLLLVMELLLRADRTGVGHGGRSGGTKPLLLLLLLLKEGHN